MPMFTDLSAPGLLGPNDPTPVLTHGVDRHSPFLVLCDHAGNAVPQRLLELGLGPEQRRAHIAWDIWGWEHAVALADALQAPALGQAYSRLVIDCNRRHDAADSIAEISDGIVVPGNQQLSRDERTARQRDIMQPYQDAVGAALRANDACIIAVHTCTAQLAGGAPRPWHVGVIADVDRRLQRGILAALHDTAMVIGDNEPYQINPLTDYTLPIHAEAAGRPYVEFELRNDLFSTDTQRQALAAQLARAIRTAYGQLEQEVSP